MIALQLLGERVTMDEQDRDDETGHLDEIEDGCGCTEIWEHMSERRGDE